jgi:hypothetical protein
VQAAYDRIVISSCKLHAYDHIFGGDAKNAMAMLTGCGGSDLQSVIIRSLPTIVFRGGAATPITLPCNPIVRGALDGNTGCIRSLNAILFSLH